MRFIQNKNRIFAIIVLSFSMQVMAQTVYEHITNEGIYEFLDEMANQKFIELNSLIKPYSRKMIYSKLQEINEKQEASIITLNNRQQNELVYFLQSYALESDNQALQIDKYRFNLNKEKSLFAAANPPGLFYQDSVFSFAIQPIIGASYSYNSNGGLTHTWGGASMFGYVGKNLAFYTNVRDENVSQLLINPEYFVQTKGVPVKDFGDDGVDYSEARGGIMYNWKWGSIGLVKDHIQWGTGYNGTNIQSGRTPSFAHIKLQIKPNRWFEFNYYHGWLVSDVIDSARSYWTNNTYRVVYFQKYMAANMFTFYPVKHLNVSFGNSVVYGGDVGGGPHAAYLVPFLFYKSVDLTLSSADKYGYIGSNNQLFLNISSRNIEHLHLYFSLFADDISISYFFNRDLYNSFSYKVGFRLSNFYLQNLIITGEYTLTNPYVYMHHAETQNYTSNMYNMGHYLRDNSQEFYLSFRYIPLRGLTLELAFSLAQHGDDYNINEPPTNLHSDPRLKNIIWQNQSLMFTGRYEIVSNTYIFVDVNIQDITGEEDKIQKYTPEYYWGKTNTYTFGMNVGF
jgi:hypothetical protein